MSILAPQLVEKLFEQNMAELAIQKKEKRNGTNGGKQKEDLWDYL